MIKPYRLINSFELQQLNKHYSELIDSWTTEYCVHEMTVDLKIPPKNTLIEDVLIILSNNKPLAFIDKHYLSCINYSLFGEDHKDFNPCSSDIFSILINKLFGTEQMSIEEAAHPIPNWLYPGSTCLALTLTCNEQHVKLVLNPEWVYQQLPSLTSQKSVLNSFDKALETRTLRLNIELNPINISLNHLITLQVGDVLSTDHLIGDPVQVKQANQLIAHAELGQFSSQKSISLKRGLHEHYR